MIEVGNLNNCLGYDRINIHNKCILSNWGVWLRFNTIQLNDISKIENKSFNHILNQFVHSYNR